MSVNDDASMTPGRRAARAHGYLRTDGNRIVDEVGNPAPLSGLNWFGMETPDFVVHGLWSRNLEDVLDQVAALGYNSIRVPFSNEALSVEATTLNVDYDLNPDLRGLTPLRVMDRIIEGAGARGLRIILDNHRSTAGFSAQESGLWYTDEFPEERWIADWEMLTRRYLGDPTVVAMDVRNEPHTVSCWGCGDPRVDWRLAAERAGNAILAINPELLILVEGTECHGPGGITDRAKGAVSTWWGGNLSGAARHPIRLDVPQRLVYAPHDYSAAVFVQTWFDDPAYPGNLRGIWDHFWGYLHYLEVAPVLVGEFGAPMANDSDRQWFEVLCGYIAEHGLSWSFWSLNPNSGDTGGMLLPDWTTVDEYKHDMLGPIRYPLLGDGIHARRRAPGPVDR